MGLRVAVIAYHANAEAIYKKEWIDQFRESILGQTYKDFTIYELNYAGESYRIFENSIFHSKKFPSFVAGLNYLLDCLFFMGYDCVANCNVDDVYALDRLDKQLPYIMGGYDLVAGNFSLTKEGVSLPFKTHHFDKLNIELELSNNHNCICHPLVIYSKAFWLKNRYVPEQLPLEDMMLWQRAIKNSKFIILPDVLLFHRLHSNSVCQSENR